MVKTHDYNTALKASEQYFGNELSAKAFVDKYALRNNDNELLETTPNDLHKRIAKELARIEKNKFKKPLSFEQIFSYLENFNRIIPQGSLAYGIGNKYQYVSLSNCFVLQEPEDSYGGIMHTDQQLVQISKRRGGVGISLNNLRPEGSATKNSSRTSTGLLSWMKRYSNSIREVGQCIKYDQRVLTSNGLKDIQDIRPLELVWSKEGWTLVNKVIKSGVKKVYKVTTDTGYSIETSINHIFQTHDKDGHLTETKLRDLQVGDNITLCIGSKLHKLGCNRLQINDYANSNYKPANCSLPQLLNIELAYLLGYSYGDGYVEQNKHGENSLSLSCSNDYPDIKTKLETYCKIIFNYTIRRNKGDGNLENIKNCNKTIVKFLKHNHLLKQKSRN